MTEVQLRGVVASILLTKPVIGVNSYGEFSEETDHGEFVAASTGFAQAVDNGSY
ncbi:MAG: hypothetical protein HYU39_08965 [Thaumarchaeota archaeon]|nr:hypothetical protein [Nitrososphaerota archaeon]